ncbi:MAG: type-F conjugative transfer system pilin assembly protein TrbC [Chlamydiia bacterium]|nr:type-F conjugative transfer system pilin assembly protein TrbC [Chlamydiia bacterium]
MKAVTFCRALFLITIFLFSKGYGDITSYQTKKQGATSSIKKKLSLASKATSSQETKCPSGGCFEGAPTLEDYPLLVFISFSMPEASLLALAKELETNGGAFLVRGLPNNSFAEFFNKLNLLKEMGMDAPILIDPDSFEEYEVTEVPTIVLKGDEAFDKMSGNVPASYALETFAEKGEKKHLAKQVQRISLNVSKQCKQHAHDKHCIPSNRSIQSKQGIQNLRGIQ